MKKTLIFLVCATLVSMTNLTNVFAVGPDGGKGKPTPPTPTPTPTPTPSTDPIPGFTVNSGKGMGGEGTFTSQANDSALTVGLHENQTGKGFTFGTYTCTYDAQGNILHSNETTIGSVGADGSTIISTGGESVSSVVSGAFAEGTVAGLWVEYEGVMYYSDGSYGGHQHVDTKNEDPFVCFDVPGTGKGPGGGVQKIRLSIDGGSVKPASGQPLPGVLATVALAGAFGGYLKRRKANRQS